MPSEEQKIMKLYFAVDWRSLGILTYQFITGEPPSPNVQQSEESKGSTEIRMGSDDENDEGEVKTLADSLNELRTG